MTESRPICDLCETLVGLPAFNDPHPRLVLTESLPIKGRARNPARRDRYRCTTCQAYWSREVARLQSDKAWVLETRPAE